LQPAELPKFFKALDQETSTTIKDYILILLLTGARRGNVLSMKWDEMISKELFGEYLKQKRRAIGYIFDRRGY